MTFKLVTLMIVVLVITLGALAGLMAYTQAQVMDELQATVSAVGRATLHSLEAGLAAGDQREEVVEWKTHEAITAPRRIVVRIDGGGEPVVVREESDAVAEPSAAGSGPEAAPGAGDDEDIEQQIVVLRPGGPNSAVAPAKRRGFFIASGDFSTGEFEVHRREAAAARASGNGDDRTDRGQDGDAPVWHDRRELRRNGETVVEERFLIAVDEVAAEQDPALGMVLRIPTLDDDGPAGIAGAGGGEVDGGAAMPVLGRRRDIVLPVPTHDFEHQFASLRRRSLYLFLTVLLVGCALSAALAARFTRPVRRLDDAFRRLSSGDLDVVVAAGGRDEIGRLSQRFNEMAAALRRHRQRNRELARREKLSALGQLAAGVAHDVRNPLHSIGLTLEELRESCRPVEARPREEFDRCLGILRQELDRLDGLVTNFLRFTRRQPRERAPLDVGELAGHVVQLVAHQARRRSVEIEAEIDPGLGEIEGDGEAVQAALLNVVLNALEAMPGGGRLRLTCRGDENAVRIEVEDEGDGIPAEDLDRAFEFGFTTKEEGHGLGLAMVHQIVVEEHGGSVELSSREGRGSRVEMILPRGGGASKAGEEK